MFSALRHRTRVRADPCWTIASALKLSYRPQTWPQRARLNCGQQFFARQAALELGVHAWHETIAFHRNGTHSNLLPFAVVYFYAAMRVEFDSIERNQLYSSYRFDLHVAVVAGLVRATPNVSSGHAE